MISDELLARLNAGDVEAIKQVATNYLPLYESIARKKDCEDLETFLWLEVHNALKTLVESREFYTAKALSQYINTIAHKRASEYFRHDQNLVNLTPKMKKLGLLPKQQLNYDFVAPPATELLQAELLELCDTPLEKAILTRLWSGESKSQAAKHLKIHKRVINTFLRKICNKL